MPVIEIQNLTHVYCQGTPYEKIALDNVSMRINQGEIIGVIGGNGSGKTTLMQHLNGLLRPTAGRVVILGKDTTDKRYASELWKQVGLVFQFAEQQIFEDTVFNEVAYGLKNLGINRNEIETRVQQALKDTGLDYAAVSDLAPLSLSGGMRRRVALASVFAMQPEIMVLDEPTVGLDPSGREQVINTIKRFQQVHNTTVIMVSHCVNELSMLADRIALLENGRLLALGTRHEILNPDNIGDLPDYVLPDYLLLLVELAKRGKRVMGGLLTMEEVETEIDRLLKEVV